MMTQRMISVIRIGLLPVRGDALPPDNATMHATTRLVTMFLRIAAMRGLHGPTYARSPTPEAKNACSLGPQTSPVNLISV